MFAARPALAILLLMTACSGKGGAPTAATPAGGDAAAPVATTPAAPAAAPALSDPFAAILDERARALVASAASQLGALGDHPQRTAVIARVIWQTVASDPVSRVEAMAFLLPDGRLRWGLLGTSKDADGLEIASGLAYPEGALAEGMRRPLAAGQADCDLPMIPLADVMTLPQVARTDTFAHGYGKADACRVAADGAADAWVVSLDWFGVVLRGAGDPVFVSAPAKVDKATLTFTGAPTANPMPFGQDTLVVDGAGAPICTTGADCFEIGARAVLTGEDALKLAAYGRACELGHGLSCIHMASFDTDDAAAEAHRKHAFGNFTAGCGRGDALDCAYLGISYETGQGVAKDEKAAVAAYKQACKADSPLGCFNLGGMEREGRGTRLDRKAAHRDYQHACDLGDQGGCDAADSTH